MAAVPGPAFLFFFLFPGLLNQLHVWQCQRTTSPGYLSIGGQRRSGDLGGGQAGKKERQESPRQREREREVRFGKRAVNLPVLAEGQVRCERLRGV